MATKPKVQGDDDAGSPPRKRLNRPDGSFMTKAEQEAAYAAAEAVRNGTTIVPETAPERDDADDDERLTRDQEQREDDIHDDYDDDWEVPDILDAPPARPGFAQRWVRTTLEGKDDPRNVAKRMNERWRPRRADTVPKGYHAPTIQHGEYAGYIGVEGVVLMERPEKVQNAVRKRNRDMARAQMQGVENDLHKIHDPHSGYGQPTLSNRSKVQRGRPVVADDD